MVIIIVLCTDVNDNSNHTIIYIYILQITEANHSIEDFKVNRGVTENLKL